jgi:hypothetical protein
VTVRTWYMQQGKSLMQIYGLNHVRAIIAGPFSLLYFSNASERTAQRFNLHETCSALITFLLALLLFLACSHSHLSFGIKCIIQQDDLAAISSERQGSKWPRGLYLSLSSFFGTLKTCKLHRSRLLDYFKLSTNNYL